MRTIEEIDTELWLIAVAREACWRDGLLLPNIRRADELLDERLLTIRRAAFDIRPNRIS